MGNIILIRSSFTSPGPTYPSGCISRWHLNEGEGTIIVDSKGTNTATRVGGAWSTGKFSNAVDFSVDRHCYIQSNNDCGISGSQDRSLSWWSYFYDGLDTWMFSMGHTNVAPGYSQFLRALDDYGYNEYWFAAQYDFDWQTYVAPTVNDWDFHVLTLENKHWEWYINNVRVGSGQNHPAINTPSAPITIGNREQQDWALNGKMCEVALFDHALSDDERNTVYILGEGG